MNSAIALPPKSQRLAAEGRLMLSTHGWLAKMPQPFRDAVLNLAIWRTARPGVEFMHAGDDVGGLVGIARGTGEVSHLLGHPDSRILHLVGSGFWGSYRPLIGRRRTLSITARDEVLWALIPQRQMEQLLAENPVWWKHMMELAEDNALIVAGMVLDLTRQSSLHRATAVLLRLGGCRYADPQPGASTEIRSSQNDIASVAVMSRNTFNTALGELVERGMVTAAYRSITLVDPAGMRAILDADQ